MVSGVVSNETKKSDKLINELVDTTNTVTNSMKEISAATNMTATSIEEQYTEEYCCYGRIKKAV